MFLYFCFLSSDFACWKLKTNYVVKFSVLSLMASEPWVLFFSSIATLKLQNETSSMLSFFLCVTVTVSAYSSHSPAPCRISLARVRLGLAISRGGPLRPPWAAPRRAVPSGEPPPRQRPPASSGVRAVGATAACR